MGNEHWYVYAMTKYLLMDGFVYRRLNANSLTFY